MRNFPIRWHSGTKSEHWNKLVTVVWGQNTTHTLDGLHILIVPRLVIKADVKIYEYINSVVGMATTRLSITGKRLGDNSIPSFVPTALFLQPNQIAAFE